MTFQEAPVMGTCIMNIREGGEPKKYLRERCYHHIECATATFLTAFMWRKPLNSATLVTKTHKKQKRMSDGTDTQVRAQMINKCRIKIVQRELYNVRDPPWGRDWKREREHCSHQNDTYNRFNWFIWKLTSSDSKFIQLYVPCPCLIIF